MYNMEHQIKFKTMQLLNGVKYLSPEQTEQFCYVVCHELKVDANEENFQYVRDAVKIFFNLKISIN